MTPVQDGTERVATARLIAAAAGLHPAGRALLNLWMHRGLSDAELAQMAGLDPAVVTSRKLDIVEHLSTELGLPPYEIVAALGAITRSHHQLPASHPASAPAGSVIEARASVEDGPADHSDDADVIDLPPVPPVRLRGGARPISRARLGAAAVVLVAVGIASLHFAGHRKVPAGGGQLAAVTVIGRRRALQPLAGATGPARGDVALAHSRGRRLLSLDLRGLPAPRAGHYEAWLYTTIIDSRPLGRVPAAGGRLMLALPADAEHFRSIDISLQPPGFTENSGESILRAPNPAAPSSDAGR